MKQKAMLIGIGGLGSIVLELLARDATIDHIVACDINKEVGVARCNLAQLGAMAQGYDPFISFVPLDLNKTEKVIEIVQLEKPAIILSTASLQTWWLPNLLPPDKAAIIKSAGFGVWLPVHLTLTLKLMQALKDANYSGIILTAPFPDVVNYILSRINLAPTCGVGNIDEIVPKLRFLAAQKLQTSTDIIQVFLVAHHALESYAFGKTGKEKPPYFLRIEHEKKDVSKNVNADELLFSPYSLPSGPEAHFLTAGSTVRLIRAFLSNKDSFLHAPAPNGLPGGYPVIVNNTGVKLAPIPHLTPEEAIDINMRSHRFDGIEQIEDDGTVTFSTEAMDILHRELGYKCYHLAPYESEERAKELIARFREYAHKHGINL